MGTQRIKIIGALALFLAWLGGAACIGGSSSVGGQGIGGAPPSGSDGTAGSSGAGGSGNSSGLSPNPISNPNATASAAPGQQPTEMGIVEDHPPLLLIQVAAPDGTIDLSTDILAKTINLEPIDDSHCKTAKSNSAPPIFPGNKPTIYYSQSIPLSSGSWQTNACGQIVINCGMADASEGKNVMEIEASFFDQTNGYKSDKATIECVKSEYPPLPLFLKLLPATMAPYSG